MIFSEMPEVLRYSRHVECVHCHAIKNKIQNYASQSQKIVIL